MPARSAGIQDVAAPETASPQIGEDQKKSLAQRPGSETSMTSRLDQRGVDQQLDQKHDLERSVRGVKLRR